MQPFEDAPPVSQAQVEYLKAAGASLMWDPQQHAVVESIWAAGLRGRLLNQNLFIYFHQIHKSYVLAEWKKKPGDGPGAIVEIEVFPVNPDEIPPKLLPSDDEILNRLRSEKAVLEEAIAYDNKRKRDRENIKEMARKHRADIVAFLKRKAGPVQEDHPRIEGILDGRVPWTVPELLEHDAGRKVR